jgi:hypothetical protein
MFALISLILEQVMVYDVTALIRVHAIILVMSIIEISIGFSVLEKNIKMSVKTNVKAVILIVGITKISGIQITKTGYITEVRSGKLKHPIYIPKIYINVIAGYKNMFMVLFPKCSACLESKLIKINIKK